MLTYAGYIQLKRKALEPTKHHFRAFPHFLRGTQSQAQLCVLVITAPNAAWQGFPGGSVAKNPPANAGDMGLITGSRRSRATHSSILAWEIPWTEEPGGLESMGLQKSRTQLTTETTATRLGINLY